MKTCAERKRCREEGGAIADLAQAFDDGADIDEIECPGQSVVPATSVSANSRNRADAASPA